MPFKSKQQQKLCFTLQGKGKNSSWDCKKWAKETNQKSLPKRVGKRK